MYVTRRCTFFRLLMRRAYTGIRRGGMVCLSSTVFMVYLGEM